MSEPKLTPCENRVWNMITELQREFCRMVQVDGPGHPSEGKEWEMGIHMLQSQIQHRMLCNEYPSYFRSGKSEYIQQPVDCCICEGLNDCEIFKKCPSCGRVLTGPTENIEVGQDDYRKNNI